MGHTCLVFTGTYEHSIDAKNRLAIPSEVRAMLQDAAVGLPNRPLVFFVTLGDLTPGHAALAIYTEADWKRLAEELDRSELPAGRVIKHERAIFSLAERVEMDSQGRIRLPERLLRWTKLGPDVVVLGVKDHMEVRDRAAWLADLEHLLAEQPELITNPRELLRRPPTASETPERRHPPPAG